ncbi:MAG TPA: hypothetical protein VFN79_11695 [Steroidobacteraceae bacterium]|nr:hypothetical protein [Steroidobacteraceae bacterium]
MMEPSGAPGSLARTHALTAQIRARREIGIYAGALALGLLVIPLLIWLVGHRTLGPYTHGDNPQGLGPLTLYADYFSGLAHGWLGYWAVAVGPALLLVVARLWLALLRRLPRD